MRHGWLAFVVAVGLAGEASGFLFRERSFRESGRLEGGLRIELALHTTGPPPRVQLEGARAAWTCSLLRGLPIETLDEAEVDPMEPLRHIRADQVFDEGITRSRLAHGVAPHESGDWAQGVMNVLFSEPWWNREDREDPRRDGAARRAFLRRRVSDSVSEMSVPVALFSRAQMASGRKLARDRSGLQPDRLGEVRRARGPIHRTERPEILSPHWRARRALPPIGGVPWREDEAPPVWDRAAGP